MKIASESKDKHKGHAQREKRVLFGCFSSRLKKKKKMKFMEQLPVNFQRENCRFRRTLFLSLSYVEESPFY